MVVALIIIKKKKSKKRDKFTRCLKKITAVLIQMVVALIIITQLKNKTKWYISTIST